MVHSLKATVDDKGYIKLPEGFPIPPSRELTILIIDPALDESSPSDTALLSEPALAKDWSRPEEDQAWQFLQQAL